MDVEQDNNAVETPPAQNSRPKTVVHSAYPIWRKHTLVSLARAKELQDSGQDVTVTYCASNGGTCAVNYSGNPITCRICQARVRGTAQSMGLQTVPLKIGDKDVEHLPPLKLSEKKELVEGVNSGIISTFRTMPEECRNVPAIDSVRRKYYETTSRLLQVMKTVFKAEQPDAVEVFNGRHACSKFALIAAKSSEVNFNTLEITARQKPIVHIGHVVHDRTGIQDRIKSQPLDLEVAEAFYSRRRQPAGNKFAKKHKAGFVPPNTSGFRQAVSIFLSSQDEFASLGKDWDSPFLDYAPVVRAACKAHPDTFFCIRFHPNQADVAGDVVSPFDDIRQLPNVAVYLPTDQVNSYSLMDWSDVVVTFGSTITAEACWAGKAVITLGPSYFDQLGIAYTPATCDEFVELLNHELEAHSRDNAARVAYYHEFDQNPLKHLKFNGKKLVADSFRVRHAMLGRIARTMDDVACNVLKAFAKRTMKSQRNKAA